MKKKCKYCGKTKSVKEFNTSGQCKLCYNKQRKRWRDLNRQAVRDSNAKSWEKAKKDPEKLAARKTYLDWYKDTPKGKRKTRHQHLVRKFGITFEEFESLKKKQKNRCAICGKKETIKRKGVLCELAVDHNHKTGEVRELLCRRCNTGIGSFLEDIDTMEKAIKYINKHKK